MVKQVPMLIFQNSVLWWKPLPYIIIRGPNQMKVVLSTPKATKLMICSGTLKSFFKNLLKSLLKLRFIGLKNKVTTGSHSHDLKLKKRPFYVNDWLHLVLTCRQLPRRRAARYGGGTVNQITTKTGILRPRKPGDDGVGQWWLKETKDHFLGQWLIALSPSLPSVAAAAHCAAPRGGAAGQQTKTYMILLHLPI